MSRLGVLEVRLISSPFPLCAEHLCSWLGVEVFSPLHPAFLVVEAEQSRGLTGQVSLLAFITLYFMIIYYILL